MSISGTLQFAAMPPDESLLYTGFYDWRLVAASLLIAIFASHAAFDVAGRVAATAGRASRWLWLALGALTMGGGVWAMHFVGMLALSLPCSVGYDTNATLLSMVPGILASGVALDIISRRDVSLRHLAGGSVLLGTGIGAMHYSGMAALRLDGLLLYDARLFVLSLAVAVALAFLALWIKFGVRQWRWRAAVAALTMGGAVSGMHYTAMAAAYFVRNGGGTNGSSLEPTLLAGAITVVVALLTGLVLVATVAHRHFSTARALNVSEQKLRRILDTTQEGFWLIDTRGVTLEVNPALCAILGRPREEIVGHATFDFVDAANREVFRAQMPLRRAGEKSSFEVELLRPDGRRVPCLFNAAPLYDGTGRRTGSFALVGDMSARRREESYQRQAVAVFENTAEGIVITDPHGVVQSVNAAFSRVTGYDAEEVVGKQPSMLRSGRHDASFYREMWQRIDATGHWQGEIWNRRKNGEIYPEWLAISAVRNAAGEVQSYIGVFSDISHIKETQAELQRLAHFDTLTGLANRMLLGVQLSHAIDRAEREHERLAVLVLDLDGFKNVNDSFGHPAGDHLLKIVAERLKKTLRVSDTVARLGGDEFAIVVESLEDAEAVGSIAEKIIESIAEPLNLSGRVARVTTSIGISLFPDDGDDAVVLVRAADTALYAAKRGGRNTWRFHDASMADAVKTRLALEQDLRNAVERGEFELWYQPQIDLASGRVVGAEALVRWRHPRRGIVPPLEFIATAEETGLILPLGEWVLQRACRQATDWLVRGLDFGTVSVNVHGSQIERGNFDEVVAKVLAETGLPALRLELEITESFLLANAERGMGTVALLREMGVEVAIDDFGTGYSSLSYLKYLRADRLKIDRSFVRDLPDDPDDAAITRAIIGLGRSLGFKVIAEGVETEAQAGFLRAEGCDEAQGYLYARPIPAGEFEAWLLGRPARP